MIYFTHFALTDIFVADCTNEIFCVRLVVSSICRHSHLQYQHQADTASDCVYRPTKKTCMEDEIFNSLSLLTCEIEGVKLRQFFFP